MKASGKTRHLLVALFALALALAMATASGLTGTTRLTAAAVTTHGRSRQLRRPAPIRFSHAVVVDSQRITGEPSLSISPKLNSRRHHDIYVSTPFGFLTTASFIWKSEDGGQSFHLVAGQQPPLGKPDTCIGGGDSNIVNDTAGNLYFTDLQGLTDVSGAVSTDRGRSFSFTCNQANVVGVDRPWITTYRDPLTNGREYMAVDNVEQCSYECGLGQAGSNMLELTEASGTAAAKQIFSPLPGQQIEPDGIVGGLVANQRTGSLAIAHSALTTERGKLTGGSDANGNDNAVVVDVFPKGYSATTPTPVPPGDISLCKPYNPAGPCYSSTVYAGPLAKSGNSKVTVGQDFTPIAIDHNGDLYVVWAESPVNPSTGLIDGPTTVYMAVSTDNGRSWSHRIDVSGHIRGLRTNVFPWVAASGTGAVDVVWYGTKTLGKCASSTGCGSSAISGSWNVYLAQSLDAVTRHGRFNPHLSFRTAKVSEYPNHFGAICTMGIGCSTGGDRGLLDFIQVQAGPGGAAYVVWSDSANTDGAGGTSAATIDFARQISGPGLLHKAVHGPRSFENCAPGSPQAEYAANGSETPASSNLTIRSSCISGPNSRGDYVVTMRVKSLHSLTVPSDLGGTEALWLTRWELPAAHPSFAVQGHVFYAAMESDNGGRPIFYTGQTETLAAGPAPLGSGQGFFLTYPPSKTVKGHYSAKTGTITIYVPARDVGNRQARRLRLYSVTGLTATQSEPAAASSYVAANVFNLIDASAPYDAR